MGNPDAFELRAMIVPLLFARYVVNMPNWLNRTSSTHHGTWVSAAEAESFPGVLLSFTCWFPDHMRARAVGLFDPKTTGLRAWHESTGP